MKRLGLLVGAFAVTWFCACQDYTRLVIPESGGDSTSDGNICPPTACAFQCEHGFMKDAKGCEICECADCAFDDCRTEASCAPVDPGVDLCCAGYAVSELTGNCGCICPYGPGAPNDVPLFESQESCQAQCESTCTCEAHLLPPCPCEGIECFPAGGPEYCSACFEGEPPSFYPCCDGVGPEVCIDCPCPAVECDVPRPRAPFCTCDENGCAKQQCGEGLPPCPEGYRCNEAKGICEESSQAVCEARGCEAAFSNCDCDYLCYRVGEVPLVDCARECPPPTEPPPTCECVEGECEPAASTCTDIEFSTLGYAIGSESLVDPMPPDDDLCREVDDSGAVVYRSQSCFDARFPSGSPWTVDFDAWEVVELCDIYGGCEWPVGIDRVTDCGTHIEIDYHVVSPCANCDGSIPNCLFVLLPNTQRHVHAEAEIILENCSQSWLCESTGGRWHTESCGHSWCGQPTDPCCCYPGCNCGPGRNFVTDVGCQNDPECP